MTGRMNFTGGVLAGVLMLSISGAMLDQFHDGPGKPQFVKVCSGCHDAEIVLSQLQTPGEWADTLQSMTQLGAEATEEEWRLIERYIDSNLALILINKAAADELQLTMDVMPEVAAAIVKFRQEKGAFKSVDDVEKVPGIDLAKVDPRKSRFVF